MEKKNNTLIGVLKKLDTFVYMISKTASFISGVILIGMVIIICAGVFNRAVLHQSWMFVEEWTGLALIPMSYFAFGYTLRQNEHLKMDLFVNKLSNKWQNVCAIFAAVFATACMVYFLTFAYDWFYYCISRGAVSSGPMQTPLWAFSLTIVIGCGIMALDVLCYLVSRIVYAITGESPFHFVGQIGEEE